MSEYFDFSIRHFHEKLVEQHQSKRSYSWIKKILQEGGLVSKERKRKKHRRRRERKPLVGMMLHLDGSTHRWLGEEREKWDLVLIVIALLAWISLCAFRGIPMNTHFFQVLGTILGTVLAADHVLNQIEEGT